LAGILNSNFNLNGSQIIQSLTKHIGLNYYATLLHWRPTMTDSGAFSWCPATLDDVPIKLTRESNTAKNDKCSQSKTMDPPLEAGSLG
jgi:hypothetical protein